MVYSKHDLSQSDNLNRSTNVFRVRSLDANEFRNLTKTSLSNDTSVVKNFHEDPVIFFQRYEQNCTVKESFNKSRRSGFQWQMNSKFNHFLPHIVPTCV